MRVALTGDAGFLAPMDEACSRDAFGVVASVCVGFDHRAFVYKDFMIRIVGRGEVGLIGMRHVGSDQKALGQRAHDSQGRVTSAMLIRFSASSIFMALRHSSIHAC